MIPSLPSETPDTRAGTLARITSPTGLAVAVLVAITLAFYHGLWLPGLVLIKRDAFRFFLPLKQYLVERLSAGELPQWFPYEALGRPFPLLAMFRYPTIHALATFLAEESPTAPVPDLAGHRQQGREALRYQQRHRAAWESGRPGR